MEVVGRQGRNNGGKGKAKRQREEEEKGEMEEKGGEEGDKTLPFLISKSVLFSNRYFLVLIFELRPLHLRVYYNIYIYL